MTKKKVYTFNCIRCFFSIDDEQRMINHCLKKHGSTGQFGKSYKTIIKYYEDGKKTRLKL